MTNDLQEMVHSLSSAEIERELATRSLHEYIKQSWPTIEPGRRFHDNWHIQAICEHLEAVIAGDCRRLIINIPPRHMKSLICDVAFPTWAWIHKPHLQFLFASYVGSLAVRDSVKCRRLINSEWYQDNWGSKYKLTGDQNQKQRFENNKNGHRLSTSVGGSLIGEGGDVIVIDDPHNTMEVESEISRNSTLEWWDQAVPSRLNDPKTGAFVIIMQRLHQQDLTGHILNKADPGEWTHLCIPAEYEANHPHVYTSTLPNAMHKEDPRINEDELLWPNRFDEKALNTLKKSLGTYGSAGQLQQRPAPKGGGILKRKWWKLWDETIHGDFPKMVYVMQSWDTAFSSRDTASYSACTTWGVFAHKGRYAIMLMHMWRDRVEYPTLRRKARELYDDYSPDAVMIEKKASGQSLIQDLSQMGIFPIPYTPDRDKVARAHAASALFEGGVVWYPDRVWAESVVDMCSVFPAGDGADVVDTTTQALIRLRKMWFGIPGGDEDWDPKAETRFDDLAEDNVVPFKNSSLYG